MTTKIFLHAGTAVALALPLTQMVIGADQAVTQAVLTAPVEGTPDSPLLMLRRGSIDVRSAKAAALTSDKVLVQIAAASCEEADAAIAATGARVIHEIAWRGRILYAPTPEIRAGLARLRERGVLAYAGDFGAAEVLSPQLDDVLVRLGEHGATDVTVQIFTDAADDVEPGEHRDLADVMLQSVLTLASEVRQQPWRGVMGRYHNVVVRLDAAAIRKLAGQGMVVNIEPWVQQRMNGERQGTEMIGFLNSAQTQPLLLAAYNNLLTGRGFPTTPSSYPPICMVDEAVDLGFTFGAGFPADRTLRENGSPAGNSRIVGVFNATANLSATAIPGHGHLNASLAIGFDQNYGNSLDGGWFWRGMGVNPFGRVSSCIIFAPGYDISSVSAGGFPAGNPGVSARAWSTGGVVHANNWGAASAGAYPVMAQDYDALAGFDATSMIVGQQRALMIFTAGNNGSGPSTLNSPGTAKNGITVGGHESTDNDGTSGCAVAAAGADNLQEIGTFSSRGPCVDGRSKPDIVAPSSHVTGTAAPVSGYTGDGVCDGNWPAGNTFYARSDGTSHASAMVSGAASLAYRAVADLLGLGNSFSLVKPELIKAFMLSDTRYLTGAGAGGNLPTAAQGFGAINTGDYLGTTSPVRVLRQDLGLTGTGSAAEMIVRPVEATKPIVVCVVWSDPAGPTVGAAYLNNLDLAVDVGSATYLGNSMLFNQSSIGGVADARNNVEQVRFAAGTVPGNMRVRITATSLTADADPTIAGINQRYALAISNAEVVFPCGPSDVAGPNQSPVPDGALTADDIIVFLNWYFASDARADVAGPNQNPNPDGSLTADDIIVFLGRFFAGC